MERGPDDKCVVTIKGINTLYVYTNTLYVYTTLIHYTNTLY